MAEKQDAEELYEALENLYGDLYLLGLAQIKLDDIYEGSMRDAGKVLKRLQTHRRKDPQLAIGQKAQSMPRLDFICDKCGVQQHADGICANCGATALRSQAAEANHV